MSLLRIETFHDARQVADTIVMLWRTGSRHPALSRQAQELHPGLPLDVFNEAADLAWGRLTAEERRLAIEEADHAG